MASGAGGGDAKGTGVTIWLGTDPLGVGTVVRVAREGAAVGIDEAARRRITAARAVVADHLAAGAVTYGITTGLGALADVRIDPDRLGDVQHNVLRSHAAGVGDLLPAELVRAMMLIRAGVFCAGHSGVRPVVAERLVDYLNAGLHPAVPSRGSVGASGDLAQLAHIGLTLIGEGRFLAEGGPPRPAAEVLADRGVEPLRLAAKEGLALVNGTDGMAAAGALACADAAVLLRVADVAAAMSVEAALGTDQPFRAEVQALRPHPGQARSAENLRVLLAGSHIVASHRDSAHAVQDPYSLRCVPQVHGAVADTLESARTVVERELRSVVDNPVVLGDGTIASTGNFHGEPVAYALDFLAMALCGLANISERRTHLLLSSGEQRGLPPFLAAEPGLQSGYMVAQYTQASLLVEGKILAAPASVDSIPTSGLQEDHVSMGWTSALKLRQLVGIARTVLAIEVICAARALDLRAPLRPAAGTAAALSSLREVVAPLDGDRELTGDVEAVERIVTDGTLLGTVEDAVGPLA